MDGDLAHIIITHIDEVYLIIKKTKKIILRKSENQMLIRLLTKSVIVIDQMII